MILLDSDVLLLDQRYTNDPRHLLNRQVLQMLRAGPMPLGIMQQALLEVVGILSYNVAVPLIPKLTVNLPRQYGLSVVPNLQQHPDFAGCTVQELIIQMTSRMSLPDSVQAVQIARYAPGALVLLTWNARHFVGKMVLPVLTPQEWLAGHSTSTP